jgi:hypothetical protein
MYLKKITLIAIFALSSSAFASPRCEVAKGPSKSEQEVTAHLKEQGFEVRRVKSSKGCYEVYARRSDGVKVELYVDPVTLKILKQERE